MTITFIGCYLTFFIAEFYFKTSGIISLVVYGIYMGNFSKSIINHHSLHSLEQIWSFF